MADYYISKSTGNNSNNGTINSPWETLSKLSTAGLQPGDKIYLKRGDIWKETLTVPVSGNSSNKITFDAYGTGVNPIITGKDIIANSSNSASWTNIGTNIWKLVIGHHPRRIWVDGVEWTQAQDNSKITQTEKFAYTTEGSGTIYVYSTSNPSNKVWEEAGARTTAFTFNQRDYIIAQNLDIRGGRSVSVECYGDYNTIQYCNIGKDAGLHGMLAHGDGRPDFNSRDGIIRYNMIDSNDACMDLFENTNKVQDGIRLNYGAWNWKVYGNIIKNWGHTGIYITGSGGSPSGYKTTGNRIYSNVITAGNVDYSRGIGTDGADGECEYNYIYNNYIVNNRVRNQINGNNNFFFNNIIDTITGATHRTDETAQGISFEAYTPYTSCHDNEIVSNFIMNCNGPGLQVWGYVGAGNKTNNKFINNKFYNCGLNPKTPSYKDIFIYVDAHATVLSQYYFGNEIISDSTSDNVNYRADGIISIDQFNGKLSDICSYNKKRSTTDMKYFKQEIYEIIKTFKTFDNYTTEILPLITPTLSGIITEVETPVIPPEDEYDSTGKTILNFVFDPILNTNTMESGSKEVWDIVLSYLDNSNKYLLLLSGEFPYPTLYLTKKLGKTWNNVFIESDLTNFETYKNNAILNVGFNNDQIANEVASKKECLVFGNNFTSLVSGTEYKGILFNQYFYNEIKIYQYMGATNYIFTALVLSKKNDNPIDIYERIKHVLSNL